MNQIKTEVSHYVQTEYAGSSLRSHWRGQLDKGDLFITAKRDFKKTGIKSKFRPVYKENL